MDGFEPIDALDFVNNAFGAQSAKSRVITHFECNGDLTTSTPC
jgi:hypothetical protein